MPVEDPWHGLGGSAYAKCLHGKKIGRPSPCDLNKESHLHETVRELIKSGKVLSAHDSSDGGLLIAAIEMGISRNFSRNEPEIIGMHLEFDSSGTRLDSLSISMADCSRWNTNNCRGITDQVTGRNPGIPDRDDRWGFVEDFTEWIGSLSVLDARSSRQVVEFNC